MLKKLKAKIKQDNEHGARESVLEELFYDFHRSRFQVYKMNFIRGIYFGFGSVLGGTVLILILIWLLSMLAAFIPPIGDFLQSIIHSLKTPVR